MLMPSGSKWEIYIPQELAYGERGAGRDIAPYSALIFTLELQSIVERPKVTESNDIPVTKSLKNSTSTVKSSKKSAPQKSVRTRK
nr:FKBP-type peptidyl-prolyl cis-trans isomerase [Prevotella micans]